MTTGQPPPSTRDMARAFLWMGIAFLALALSVTAATLLRGFTPPGEASVVLVDWTGRQFSKPRRIEMAFTVIDPASNAATIEAGHRYRGEVGIGMREKTPRPGDHLRVYLPPDDIPRLVPIASATEAWANVGVLPWFWLIGLLWLFVAAALHRGLPGPKPK